MSDVIQFPQPAAQVAPQTCPGDNKPCHVGSDEDGHWRCGTCQCGQTELHKFYWQK